VVNQVALQCSEDCTAVALVRPVQVPQHEVGIGDPNERERFGVANLRIGTREPPR
jgi:hypothetical protein